MTKTMHSYENGTGAPELIITVILFFISRFTLTDLAGIATIFAAVSTAILNIYRFIKMKKRK